MTSRYLHPITVSLLLAAALALAPGPAARGEEVTEETLKALFLVNVLGYVERPGRARPDAYGICMAASERFSSEVRSQLQLRGLGSRIAARDLDSARSLDGCDVVFLESDTVRGAGFILKEAREKGLLTVGSGDRFIDRGGIIRLYLKDKKLAFDISARTAGAAGIKINSRLLSLAKKVY
uniref:YfiR family protein n=1 Tax=Geobacter metallireducens TaxID=28232 RepID=A0A831XDK4_GEOME